MCIYFLLCYTSFQVAAFDFEGESSDELNFKAGQQIQVLQTPEGGWWEGVVAERTGWFPAAFVLNEGVPMIRPRLETVDEDAMSKIYEDIYVSGGGGDDDDDEMLSDLLDSRF